MVRVHVIMHCIVLLEFVYRMLSVSSDSLVAAHNTWPMCIIHIHIYFDLTFVYSDCRLLNVAYYIFHSLHRLHHQYGCIYTTKSKLQYYSSKQANKNHKAKMSVKNALKFDRFFKSQEHSDVEFVVRSRDGDTINIPAHRLFLMPHSDVFERMLFGELKEGFSVKVVDVCAEVFEEFLSLFYCAEVTLTPDNIAEVLMLIDKYNAVNFLPVCEDFLSTFVTIKDAYHYYELTAIHSLSDKLAEKLEKFVCENSLEVLRIHAENALNMSLLPKLLKSDHFRGTEIQIFEGVFAWVKASLNKKNQPITVENIRDELGECLDHIRFPTMTLDELLKCFREYPRLLPAEEIIDILSFVANKNHELTHSSKFITNKRHEWILKFRNTMCVNFGGI